MHAAMIMLSDVYALSTLRNDDDGQVTQPLRLAVTSQLHSTVCGLLSLVFLPRIMANCQSLLNVFSAGSFHLLCSHLFSLRTEPLSLSSAEAASFDLRQRRVFKALQRTLSDFAWHCAALPHDDGG